MKQPTFDVETGMAVFGANGRAIGTITQVAGFGSTRTQPASGSTGVSVTEAQSGTGYIKVVRPDGEDLYVPFHGIEEVIPGRGVTLTATMVDDLRRKVDALPPQTDVTAQPQRPGWLLRLRRWRLVVVRQWQSKGQAATGPGDADRDES